MSNHEHSSIQSGNRLTIAAKNRKVFEALFSPLVGDSFLYLSLREKTKSCLTYTICGTIDDWLHWDNVIKVLPYLLTKPETIVEVVGEGYDDEQTYWHKFKPKKATKEQLMMLESVYANYEDHGFTITIGKNLKSVTMVWEDIIYTTPVSKNGGVSNTTMVNLCFSLTITTARNGIGIIIDGETHHPKDMRETYPIVESWVRYFRSKSN